jgi:hypothetical protein
MSRVCGGLCDKLVPRSFDVDDSAYNAPDRLYPAQFMNVSAAIANPLSWGCSAGRSSQTLKLLGTGVLPPDACP